MNKKDIEGWLEDYRNAIRSMDTERWVGRFAEDATVEDPVGGPVHKGREQLVKFFNGVKKFSKLLDMRAEFTVITPPEAVVKFAVCNTTQKGFEVKFEGVGHYKFNEDGKMIKMRAFWDPASLGK
ncbi:MAG: nuclear transport factor 2 family protein [Desulfobacterales bacterium]|nr:nuclear transport factor 2 family protein [Desulfobacterales bacterium]